MNTLFTLLRRPLLGLCLISLLALLAACGGGGGDGGSAAVAPAVKSWGTAQLVETDDRGDATEPDVVVDAAGNAIAVWYQSDGTSDNIMFSRYTAGQGWDTPVDIDNGSQDAFLPSIAMDTNGNVMAVWSQQGSAGIYNIYANRYDASTRTWEGAMLIEKATGSARYPQIAFDAAGNAMAVWTQFMTSEYRIRAARYDAVSGWEAPVLIETTIASDAKSAKIAMDTSGNAIAVWSQVNATTLAYDIWGNSYTPGTGWDVAKRVSNGTGNSVNPQVASDAAGNFFFIWKQDGAIMATRSIPVVGPSVAVPIDDAMAGSSDEPRIAVDPAGNAIAVWSQYDGSTRSNVYANRYDVTNGMWGLAQLVETDDGDVYSAPQIAVDTGGNAIAVWIQLDSADYYNIRSNRYTVGTGWGATTLVDAGSFYEALSPQIAIDASGNATVVWEQYDSASASYDIWANRFQ